MPLTQNGSPNALRFFAEVLTPNRSTFLHRPGQAGVPPGSREPGNLSKGIWPDRALLQPRGRGPIPGPGGWLGAAAVPLPAVRGPDGGLSAIMSTLPFMRPPSSPHETILLRPSSLLSLYPQPRGGKPNLLRTLPHPLPISRELDFNHLCHDYLKKSVMMILPEHICVRVCAMQVQVMQS